MALDPCQQHHVQQQHAQHRALPQQQLSLCSRLVTLDLQALELPPPLLLEAVLLGLQGLRCLRLHASMESILEVSSRCSCWYCRCTA